MYKDRGKQGRARNRRRRAPVFADVQDYVIPEARKLVAIAPAQQPCLDRGDARQVQPQCVKERGIDGKLLLRGQVLPATSVPLIVARMAGTVYPDTKRSLEWMRNGG